MSKSTNLLRDILLTDIEGNRSRIVHVDSSETYFDIYTMSPMERASGIATRHRIHSEECSVEELDAIARKTNEGGSN